MRKLTNLFFCLSFLALNSLAQIPAWENSLQNDRVGGTSEITAVGEHILLRKRISTAERYPEIPQTFVDELTILDTEGIIINRKPVKVGNYFGMIETEGVNILDSAILVFTNISTTDQNPNPGFQDAAILKYNFDLDLIDSNIIINNDLGKERTDNYFIQSTTSVWNLDTCFSLKTYFVLDSQRYLWGIGSAATFGDTNAFKTAHYQDRRWVRRPQYLEFIPSRRLLVSEYDLRHFTFDLDFNWTDEITFWNDEEPIDEFLDITSYPGALLRIKNNLFFGSPAVTRIKGFEEGGHMLRKYDAFGNLLDQNVVARDTFDWPTGIIHQNFTPAWGKNSMAYDGDEHIYTFGHILSDRRWFVTKTDTNLNIKWYREWYYDTEETWEAHSALVHPDFDGVYLSGVKLDPGEPTFGGGDFILYRLGADGDLSSATTGPAVSATPFLSPNPARNQVNLLGEHAADIERILFHPIQGGTVKDVRTSSGTSLDISELLPGSYIAIGYGRDQRPVAQQKFLVVR